MKKVVILLVLATLVAGGVFGQSSKSAGGGLLFDMSSGNGYKVEDIGESFEIGMNNTVIGAFAFFDFTYAVIDLSIGYGMITNFLKYEGTQETYDGDSMLQLGIGILGKYPIYIGSFTLFPMLGINYNIALSYVYESGTNYNDGYEEKDGTVVERSSAEDFSQFGILAGVGFDFPLSYTMYLRAEALFNLRFPSKLWSDMTKESNIYEATLGVGPRIKVGIGFNL